MTLHPSANNIPKKYTNCIFIGYKFENFPGILLNTYKCAFYRCNFLGDSSNATGCKDKKTKICDIDGSIKKSLENRLYANKARFSFTWLDKKDIDMPYLNDLEEITKYFDDIALKAKNGEL